MHREALSSHFDDSANFLLPFLCFIQSQSESFCSSSSPLFETVLSCCRLLLLLSLHASSHDCLNDHESSPHPETRERVSEREVVQESVALCVYVKQRQRVFDASACCHALIQVGSRRQSSAASVCLSAGAVVAGSGGQERRAKGRENEMIMSLEGMSARRGGGRERLEGRQQTVCVFV